MDDSGGVKSVFDISVVTYGPDLSYLERMIASLAAAASNLPGGRVAVALTLVDNGPYDARRSGQLARFTASWGERARVLSGHGNVGYGRGHNLALALARAPFFVVLNPDVELAPDALLQALDFFDDHPRCGLLAPAVRGPAGELQYLCKRPPSVLDLLVRGFAPAALRPRFRRRLTHYEMRDLIDATRVVWDPPIVSGCFMIFRSPVLKQLEGFDPRYFLYFEDFDLSLRTASVTRLAYVPAVRITHYGGGAAGKGLRHVGMFAASAARFFRTYGWKWA